MSLSGHKGHYKIYESDFDKIVYYKFMMNIDELN
jgi:hypothetical protein